tara:strand:- start:3980 stop:4201 length:222 start_codon:yes stop_codon:yes gene_type:complete
MDQKIQLTEFRIGDLVTDRTPAFPGAFGIIVQKTIFGRKVMHRVVWWDNDDIDDSPYELWEEARNIRLLSRSG